MPLEQTILSLDPADQEAARDSLMTLARLKVFELEAAAIQRVLLNTFDSNDIEELTKDIISVRSDSKILFTLQHLGEALAKEEGRRR